MNIFYSIKQGILFYVQLQRRVTTSTDLRDCKEKVVLEKAGFILVCYEESLSLHLYGQEEGTLIKSVDNF